MFWPELFLVSATVVLSLVGVTFTYTNDVAAGRGANPTKTTALSAVPF